MELSELKRVVQRMGNHYKDFKEAEALLDRLIGAEQVVGELGKQAGKLRTFIVDLEKKRLAVAEVLESDELAYIKARDSMKSDLKGKHEDHKRKLQSLEKAYESRLCEYEAGYAARADRDMVIEAERQKHRELLESDIKMLEDKFNQLKNAVKKL